MAKEKNVQDLVHFKADVTKWFPHASETGYAYTIYVPIERSMNISHLTDALNHLGVLLTKFNARDAYILGCLCSRDFNLIDELLWDDTMIKNFDTRRALTLLNKEERKRALSISTTPCTLR